MKRKEQKTRMQSVKRAVAMAIHAARRGENTQGGK